MIPIHQRLYALAATSEPDAAKELTECADAAKAMLAALEGLKRTRGNCGASPFEQAALDAMESAIEIAGGNKP